MEIYFWYLKLIVWSMIDCEWYNSISRLKRIYIGDGDGDGNDNGGCVNRLSSSYNQFHKWNNSLAQKYFFFSSTSKVVITSAAKTAKSRRIRSKGMLEFREKKIKNKMANNDAIQQNVNYVNCISITNEFRLLHFAYNNGATFVTRKK